MSETKFTPGPWKYKAGRKSHHEWSRLFTAKRGRTFLFGTEALSIPDCHLIAAAPDLYESLQRLVNVSAELAPDVQDACVFADARAALAKARGES